MTYCSVCGARTTTAIPEGDDRPRNVCAACRTVHYQNPRVVVGCIPVHAERVLLCRRAIEPCRGKWTLPAGYLENGETVAGCAERETLEEAGARVRDLAPYRMYNICHIHQIYFMFRAVLADPRFAPGKESLEVALFTEAEVPWEEIAFRVITETLKAFFRDRAAGVFPFTIGDIPPVRPADSRREQVNGQ
jgi:ADP-ribose pyrophosphatase YjhB (NUDIX family)